MLDPETYYPGNRDVLLRRLVFVVTDLVNLTATVADAEQQLRRARDHIITNEGPWKSENAAVKQAEFGTRTEWWNVRDLQAQIRSYEEERDLIKFLISVTPNGQ